MNKRQVVLIVDDTPENLQVLGDMLERQGYEVLVATNGPDALGSAGATPAPDLILLDIMMPGMDGYEVCRRLKADSGLQRIPVIFISALGLTEQKIQAFSAGAADYVTKPFQVEEVVARVRTHIQLARAEELTREIAGRKRVEEENAKLEAQLQQAQKMEVIGQLAGGVAHDFNNLLTVILGHAHLALLKADPAQPLIGDLEEIRKAAERSASLTRQLLAFARKQAIAPKVLDLNETVSGMFKMLQRLIGEDINLTWLPAADLWPVKMDSSQIDQIMANLCVNARDAIDNVGKVTIETGNVAFDHEYCAHYPDRLPGEYVMLTVSDTGRGMDGTTVAHIFEPFFTTKAVGKGTGLGLATVFGIIKQNNGFITVHSEPGQGTTFEVCLPRHEGPAVQQVETKGVAGTAPCGRETILLVEDEPAILNIARDALARQGYTMVAANSPDKAIRLAGEHAGTIHLLITDVVMPVMNGPDLAKTLHPLFPGLKSLFMSGYTTSAIARHGVIDNGVNFIQKPFSLTALASRVREVLDTE